MVDLAPFHDITVTPNEPTQFHVRSPATTSTEEQCNYGQPQHPTHNISVPKLPQVHQDVSRPPHKPLNGKELGKIMIATLRVDEAPPVFPSNHQRAQPRLIQQLWLYWLTPYRILIGLTFITNFAVLIWYINTDFTVGATLTASAVNFVLAILVRQEDLINVSYFFLAKTPSTIPLALRKLIADFHHYGGLHIGCACAALMWYFLLAIMSTIQYVHRIYNGTMTLLMWANMIVIWTFLFSVLIVCITALPRLRVRFHNTFEHTHRLGGWLATSVLWIHMGINTLSPDSKKPLHKDANLWILVGITLLLILPWLRIRRVPISTEPVSRRETKITFPYLNMQHMSTTRFSRHPMMDWHAFATIPNATAEGTEASIIVSQVGDWTRSIIENPPSHVWLRRPATRNFLTLAPLFNSVLLVATGAGIGPMLSLLSSSDIARMKEKGKVVRVMWCVFEPEAPHWKFVMDVIRQVDKKPRIFDSKQGRPDLAFEARHMTQVYSIEAVMVVSNKKVTNEVVRHVKAYHGAAYGAVFDS